MSENSLKRIAIAMAREDGAFKEPQALSALAIYGRVVAAYPRHSYNFATVKLYLFRLYQADLAESSQQRGVLMYQLTALGYRKAQLYWESRDELGHYEPPQATAPAAPSEPDQGLLRVAERLSTTRALA